MSFLLEEKLREAASLGDSEAVQTLLLQKVNINAQNRINGWTALHWACKRGHEHIVRLLLNNGADANLETKNGEKPINFCSHANISQLFGKSTPPKTSYYTEDVGIAAKFVPSYIANAPINGKVELNNMARHTLPITSLPASASIMVLKIRVYGGDPDYIEMEMLQDCVSYNYLLERCCRELGIQSSQVERIRKLPNTRLRNDKDVARLKNMQELELVLRVPGPTFDRVNSYQSISSCKDQTILY